jgi:hypothetical protein
MSFKPDKVFKKAQFRWHDPTKLNQDLLWLHLSGFLLFLAITMPAYRMSLWQPYWSLLHPMFIYLFVTLIVVIIMLTYLSTLWQNTSIDFPLSRFIHKADVIVLAGCIVLVSLIFLLYKTGFINDQYYWNVAAVPILTEYSYLAFGLFFFLPAFLREVPSTRKKTIHPGIPLVLIYLFTNLIMQAEPIARNTLVEFQPGTSYKYVPRSDALIYDLAGRQFSNGFGIGFWPSNDKPVFNTYVGLLHGIMGDRYENIIKLNIAVLALIPIFLFLIGKTLDSTQIGLLFASVGILFEITTFQSSGYIANIHWKLLMPEPLGQLLVLVAVFGTLRWLKNSQQKKWIYLTGIALGLGTYIRPQIVVLSVAFILIVLLNPDTKFTKRLIAAGHGLASFVLFTAPWAIYCQIHYGYVPLLSKFNWILNYRFFLSSSIQNSISHGKNAAILPFLAEPSSISLIFEKIYLVMAHFLNNIIKALLSLPTSFQMDSIPKVFEGIKYWNETAIWRGEVTPVFFLSLMVFCLGLIGLYRKTKLMGLVPLIYMFFYFAALSMSRTSGSRYLIPVIWVVYLYYFFGIVLIARFLGAFFFKIRPIEYQNSTPSRNLKEKFAAFYFIIPLVLGLVLPVLDSSIPRNQSLALDHSQIKERLSQSIVHEQANLKSSQWELLIQKGEIQYGYGELVYPEIKPLEDDPTQSRFRFNLVGSHPMVDLQFVISDLSAAELSAMDLEQPFFVLTCKQNNSNVYIPFIMQTKNQHNLFVSTHNLEICQKIWIPLINP